jgi:DNA-binding MarR family transcriptional regulator
MTNEQNKPDYISMNAEYSSTKAAEIISNLKHFMKDTSGELGINWGAFVILATLASPGISYLSSTEIIHTTGMDRCWVYRNIRSLSRRGLIDFVEHQGPRNQVRALYSINGKGSFYLTRALLPNGIRMIKAFEGRS